MLNSRIIFFAPHGNLLKDGVLHSQFLSMAAFLKSKGAECLVLGLCSPSDSPSDVQDFVYTMFGLPSKLYADKIVRFRPITNRLLPYRILDEFHGDVKAFDPTHIYTRSPRALLAASKRLFSYGVKSVYDARGAIAQEYLLTYGRKSINYFEIGLLEKMALRKASLVSCVTTKLSDYVKAVSGREVDAIIPCCVTNHKNYSNIMLDRSDLGFKSFHKIYCYSGGTSKWQRIEDVLELCLRVSKKSPMARFLFISKDFESIVKMANNKGINRSLFKAFSCEQREVAHYLSLCDAGIILRHNNLVNNVASPIKVGEYLLAGIPVLLSSGIGDYSQELPEQKIGLLVDDFWTDSGKIVNFVDKINRIEMTKRCHSFVKTKLIRDVHLDQFLKLYGKCT